MRNSRNRKKGKRRRSTSRKDESKSLSSYEIERKKKHKHKHRRNEHKRQRISKYSKHKQQKHHRKRKPKKIDLESRDISIADSDSQDLSDLRSRSESPIVPDSLYESSESQKTSESKAREKKIQHLVNRKALHRVSPLETLRHSKVYSVTHTEHLDMVKKNEIMKTKVHIQYPNNDIYRGEMRDGMRHGFGEFKDHARRRIYKGYFLNDYYHGKGKLKYPDGKVYEGEFKKGKRHGRGTCYYRVEGLKEIEPKKASKDPRRVSKAKPQSGVEVYKGYWRNGKKHGEGVYEWGNGRVYKGQ